MKANEPRRMWVVVDEQDIIVAASCDDGDADDVNFLLPLRKGTRLLHMNGPVRMGARLDAPMQFPPEQRSAHLPLFDAVVPGSGVST